jgi:hypothetical protein
MIAHLDGKSDRDRNKGEEKDWIIFEIKEFKRFYYQVDTRDKKKCTKKQT